jgi:hypothetical protein
MSDQVAVEVDGNFDGDPIPIELTISLDDESVEALANALKQGNG